MIESLNQTEWDDLTDEQNELLDRLLAERGIAAAEADTITPLSESEEPPLSFAQQRLWLLERMTAGGVYNIPEAVRLTGPLAPWALAAGLTEIVRRHRALRARFPEVGGVPAQQIAPPAPVPLPLLDLSALPADAREREGARLAGEDRRRGFDLASGPLVRAALVRLADAEHILLLTLHHIASDGWSMEILVREISILYEAFAAGRPSPLPPLPIQYPDFAAWQRRRLSGERLAGELDFWRHTLADLPALDLPTDRPRLANRTFRGAVEPVALPDETYRGLQHLARRRGATPFMTLLALYEALLARHASQERFGVGTPVAGRDHLATEGLIGCFINTLVLTADLAGDPTVGERVDHAREVVLAAFAHQEIPFEKLVEELQPERTLAVSPFFQTMFGLERAALPRPAGSALKISTLPADEPTAKIDLMLQLAEREEGLVGALTYSIELFESATVRRFAAHLAELTAAAVARPELRLSELPLLSAAERHQALVEANDTTAPWQALSFHRLFALQTARTPEALVIDGLERLTYRDLDERSNRLARRLVRMGVGPEVRVGIFLRRSPRWVVALLAVLKAGGAFVPLDPKYPSERLRLIAEDALSGTADPILLTEEGLPEPLAGSSHAGWRTVLLEAGDRAMADESSAPLLERVDLDHPAYVVYTSGSTGRPKGIVVPHRGLGNFWAMLAREFGGGEVRTLPFFALGFDGAVGDLILALACGGTLCLTEAEELLPGPEMVLLLVHHRITLLSLPPSVLAALPEVELPALTKVLVAGEAPSLDLALRWSRGQRRRFANGYGPTEATIAASFGFFDPASGRLALGRPIPNSKLFALGPELELVPPGAPGELFIASPGLARGYLGRPDLTAAAFLPDPFSEVPGGRLYRTGDLARRLPDGVHQFLGRLGRQVKIHGFRIELGEIEAALAADPIVREAAVVAEDTPHGKRLIAYAAVRAGSATGADVRRRLAERLPQPMVPWAVILLPDLPRTPNGKLDRAALPAPEGPREIAYRAPLSPTEELLAGMWSDLLGVERVGLDDDFFALGGHSLLVTRVISWVREALRVELPMRAVFESSTLAALAAEIDRQAESALGPQLPEIERAGRERPLPLSFAQQRLWILYQLDPASPVYNLPIAVELAGRLDRRALAATLSEVTRRHEVLRTTFVMGEGDPVQRVAPPAPFPLPTIDLSALPLAARRAESQAWAEREAGTPFDLLERPLVRGMLVAQAAEEHHLLLTLHHAVGDAWSMGILVRELCALYAAFAEGRPSPLPELPVQYADYAVWQRGWMSGARLDAEVAYWRERLGNPLPVLELPTDRPRPAVQTFVGARRPVLLPPALLVGARDLAQKNGATLFMTLLGVFQALLGRYSGQEKLLVGTPVAGRSHRRTEGLIGFFVNLLALRAELPRELRSLELLHQVRESTLAAYAHQDVPFERLVLALENRHDLSRPPIFQTVFTFAASSLDATELPGLALMPVLAESGTAKFDLTASMTVLGDRLAGTLEYNRDLFDSATVQRMAGHFGSLLSGMIVDPERRVSELPLLTEVECGQTLREWNDTAKACPQVPLVHELFALHARRRPQATAVASPHARLTYGELEARSNRLAHHLRGLGVGPERLVALCTERTLTRVVGIVAVLKAGGAYVSLDPTYPKDRLAFLLTDARAQVVLTESEFVDRLPETGVRTICLDTEGGTFEGSEETAPLSGVTPENLAYVVYTSGSTGKPKGVEIPHAGLMNLVRWHQDLYEVTPEDRGTQIASPAFDASIWELWPYLAGGASVHIPDEETRLSSPGMVRWWAEQGITLAYLMTPLAEGVLEVDIPRDSDLRVRALIIGGDRLHRGPDPAVGFRLMNHYGPAEYSVTATVVQVPPGSEKKSLPSIGRPVDNTRIYILSQSLELSPAGVPGELFVAGVGLARGYHRRPDLTAQKFLPDPWSEEPGARMYQTGDLVRYLVDGDMDFLGRLDHQVKLRGLRIELGEIESALDQHPAVRQSAVLVREDRPGHKLLVAYLAAHGEPPANDRLRAFLKESLPDYMVPKVFVLLDALPLTPNGKVDRRALPVPPAEYEDYIPPATAVEEALAGIWETFLKRDRVGSQDNFFELGGHSLVATRVMSRLRETLGVDLPLRKIFEAPTVAALALEVEAARRSGRRSDLPPFDHAPAGVPLPLSFAQQRLWFMDRVAAERSAYNNPSAFLFEGPLDLPLLGRVLTEIVRRQAALRTTFTQVDGVPAQVVGEPARVSVPLVDFRRLSSAVRERELGWLAQEEARRPFDLAAGPLLRVTAVALERDLHAVLSTLHHITSDGWAVGILARELSALYAAFSSGRPSPLPEPEIQYADYAVWQRRWAEEGGLSGQLAYWRDQLRGVPALTLPTDRPRGAAFSFRGAMHSLSLDRDLAAALSRLGREAGATLFMTLLAGFDALLARWTGQEDFAVGTDIANRNQGATEDLIGCFVNNLVLRADLQGNPTFRELLGRVRETTLGAYANQDLPFDLLVRELNPERTMSHTPLFQVLFVLQNAPRAALALPGLRLTQMNPAADSVKFDLALFASETEDGLAVYFRYNPDLWNATTIARMAGHFEKILRQVAARPETRIQQLEVIDDMKRAELAEAKVSRLQNIRERSANRAPAGLVALEPALPDRNFPLTIKPRVRDLDLAGWAGHQHDLIESQLLRHGAILFRGFRVASVGEFENLARAICPDLYGEYGDLPREQEGEKVYHSTPYPADKTILFHNESSHMDRWPLKQFFFCIIPAAERGETPIVDGREIYAGLDPEVRRLFAEKRLMYVRNFVPGFDVSWQDFFRTGDRAEVERRCRAAGLDFRWKGEGLETRQVAPAVARHPKTGEMVFFNQIQLHHPASLEPEVRDSLVSVVGADNLPRNVLFGDGTEIPDSLVEEITQLYWDRSVALPWEKGDVILVDNMLIAHARNPFTGPRKIVVAMGEIVDGRAFA